MILQKKKSLKLLLTAMVAGALMVPSLVSMAAAANQEYVPYVCGDSDTTTFKKYLIVDENATVPNVSFSFNIAAIAAEEEVSASATSMRVYSGKDAVRTNKALPTVDTVAFSSADVKTLSDGTGTIDQGLYYVSKDVTVSFDGVEFYEPGIYRYVLTENTTTAVAGITFDNRKLYLDVFVVDDEDDATMTMDIGYVLHEGTNITSTTDKVDGFINTTTTHDLTIEMAVAGNQASRDEFFKATVNITGAVPNTVYSVTGDNTGSQNPTTITAGSDGKIEQIFWLQGGQDITILGLPEGANYSIVVSNEAGNLAADGYTADIVSDPAGEGAADNSIATFTDTVLTDGIKNNTTVTFTLTKDGQIPTGVILAVAPAAVLALVGGIGITSVVVKNRNKNDEE